MLEPLLWDGPGRLVPMSVAHTEDLLDIACGTYGFEPGETQDADFAQRYARIILLSRHYGQGFLWTGR